MIITNAIICRINSMPNTILIALGGILTVFIIGTKYFGGDALAWTNIKKISKNLKIKKG